MAFCENCGNNLNDGARFCSKCGAAVSAGQVQGPQMGGGSFGWAQGPQMGGGDPFMQAFNAGIESMRADRDYDAIGYFTQAIQIKPDSTGALFQRGQAFGRIGQYEAAIADLTTALQFPLDKRDMVYSTRGTIFYMAGAYDRAIADLDQAIKLNPHNAGHYGVRGMAYFKKGNIKKANADLERGLKIDPTDEAMQQLAALYN